MNYPPDSFWILVESPTSNTQILSQGSRRVKIDTGRWHCLPNYWKPEAIELEQNSQTNQADIRVYLWPKAMATV